MRKTTMKLKIEIKNKFTGTVLFELETENNTVKNTLVEAVKQGADLRGAYLQGADLRGAYLQGAYLQGADLQGHKIKSAAVFTGLYAYVVIPYITETDEHLVKMGCYDRTVSEWDADFWNNDSEFPNNNSIHSNQRLLAYNTAKAWLELASKQLKQA